MGIYKYYITIYVLVEYKAATLGRGVFAFPQIMRATPSLSADGNFRVIGDQCFNFNW
jgi:hypothetical protein